MTATWNPSDNVGLALSNGNLTATNLSGSGVWYTCRATPFFLPSNRVYAEFTASNVGVSDSNVYIAVMTAAATLSVPGLFDANSFGYNQNGSTAYDGVGATLATWTTGNVICLAVDGNAGKVWARVNGGNWNNDGTGTANPTSNVGGISAPNLFNQGAVYFGVSIHTLNYAVTGKFDGGFTYAVPAGFSAMPPVVATPSNSAFASASVGLLRGVESRTGLGVAAGSGVGLLLPTTAAIGSVFALARVGTPTLKQLTCVLTGVTGSAVAQGVTVATASSIYSYEGFDHQAAQADLLQGTITSFVNSTGSLSALTPYNSGGSLAVQVIGPVAGYAIYNSGPFTLSRCVLGVMTQSNMFNSIGTDVGFLLGNTVQLFCRLSGSNITVYRGPLSAPVLLSTLFYAIPAIGWFFLELNVVIAAASGGSLAINVNGVQVANLPNITSSSDGTPRFNGILLGGITNATTTFLFDDVYVATTPLGTIRVATMFPNANGNVVQFLTSGTTANWHRINDRANDADISYNFSSTFGLTDQFALTPLPATISSIVAMKVIMSARKDAITARIMGTLVVSNTTTKMGVSNALSNTYQYLSDIFLLDPNTGTAWTQTSANAAQIGYSIREAGGSGYIGPGDIVTGAMAWYGLRAYSKAVAATGVQKAITIRRASDNATADILILSNGRLDIATATAFCAATTGFVTTWYDQTGQTGNVVQATSALQPQLVFNGIGGVLPTVSFNGAVNQILAGGTLAASAQPWSISAVASVSASINNYQTIIGTSGTFENRLQSPPGGPISGYAGAGLSAPAALNTFHSLQFTANSTASVMAVDGVSTIGDGGSNSLTARGTVLNVGTSGSALAGSTDSISEVGIWPSGFNPAQVATMSINQKVYWLDNYLGPGDIVSGASVWYGLRAYSIAVAVTGTQKAINIRRASDNATADIVLLPNGNLDVATAASFLAATTGFITKWYDQSGNGRDVIQATPANQPQLLLTGANGKPTVVFTAAGAKFLSTAAPGIAQPLSFVSVAMRTGNFTSQGIIFGNGSFKPLFGFGPATNNIFLQGGGTNGPGAAAADNVLHSVIGVVNLAASALNIDGVTSSAGMTSGDWGQLSNTAPLYIGEVLPSTWMLTGNISEAAIWPVDLSAPQQVAMLANQKTYWGTP